MRLATIVSPSDREATALPSPPRSQVGGDHLPKPGHQHPCLLFDVSHTALHRLLHRTPPPSTTTTTATTAAFNDQVLRPWRQCRTRRQVCTVCFVCGCVGVCACLRIDLPTPVPFPSLVILPDGGVAWERDRANLLVLNIPSLPPGASDYHYHSHHYPKSLLHPASGDCA